MESPSNKTPDNTYNFLGYQLWHHLGFTTVTELFKQIYSTTGDALTVQGVSPEDFASIDKERSARRRKFTYRISQTQLGCEEKFYFLSCTGLQEIINWALIGSQPGNPPAHLIGC